MNLSTLLRRTSLFLLASAMPLLAQGTLTGIVTNKTHDKPSAGDEVVLIRLQQGMQEAAHTKTDAKGHFTLQLPDAGIHLVRVAHDGAAYFRPAPPGTESVEVEVYDAAPSVKGIRWGANVLRMQTDDSGKRLKVVENFFVENESMPKMTQFSDKPFDFWLPEGAVVNGSAALGPGGMPVQASPVPLAEKNHFAFSFPIRPGETRFQLSYEIPYTGSLQLAPKPTMKTDTVALMMPKSMKFSAASGANYTSVAEEVNAQTYIVRDVTPGQPLGFTLSGTGQLPRDTGKVDEQQQDGGQGRPNGPEVGDTSSANDTKPGIGLGNPIDTPDPLTKYKGWIIGGLALAFAAAAGFMLSQPKTVPVLAAPTGEDALMHTLKDELFTLETDKATGKLTEEAYLQQKAALETVLKRAIERKSTATK